MLLHGPDREAFDHASNSELKPVKLPGTMAFMFETRHPQRVTAHAANSPTLQDDYADCWKGLEKRFDPNRPRSLTLSPCVRRCKRYEAPSTRDRSLSAETD